MRKILLFGSFISAICFFGCNERDNIVDESSIYDSEEFGKLVEMHCRAVDLKNRRFSLADTMRISAEERHEALADKVQRDIAMKDFESLKHDLTVHSRTLSDSIRIALQELTSGLSVEEKRVFNDSLNARAVRAGCRTEED